MWEDILTKETLLDLITKFIFVQTKEETDELTGKKKIKETLIFPRYHQLDVIRRLLADLYVNRTTQNYLIQHSAGSGKTNSIAWLAHRLTSLHDEENKVIFDNVVIVTDRVVVDRQLQSAVLGMEHKTGLIRVMDEKCTSADLALALKGNTKIIATTIQKFPYIVDTVKGLKQKRFAVIIDEAHSSTAGKDMAAITMTLGKGEASFDTEGTYDSEDVIVDELARNGKQPNVSMFAFTATPKATTLELFGRQNEKGQKQAFHIYSMKQAIEEGFILDVLQNFTEYKNYPEVFSSRSRLAVWALWYLVGKEKFGCEMDSEFLMIDLKKNSTQQNYFYPYELFEFYALQIYLLIKEAAKLLGVEVSSKYRFVYVDAFLSFIALERMQKHER